MEGNNRDDLDPSKLEFRMLPEWRVEEVIHEMDQDKRKRLLEELYRRIEAKENVYYAEFLREGEPGIPVGLGSWRIRAWPRMEGPKEACGLVELSFIWVHPTYRGLGIGKALVDHAVIEASKHFEKEGYPLRKVYAMITSGNEKGVEIYRRWGFEVEAELKMHFSGDNDMYLLSMFL